MAPVSVVTLSPAAPHPVGVEITFDASGSIPDSGETITDYAWSLYHLAMPDPGNGVPEFTDGFGGSATRSWTPTVPGRYFVVVVVQDSGGGFSDGDVDEFVYFDVVDTYDIDGDCSECCGHHVWEFSEQSFYACTPPPPRFSPPVCIPGAQLGNGEDTRILLTSRGGRQLLAELSPTSGYFERKLNATSALEVGGVVPGFDDDCCGDWSKAVPWVTEIMVWRDGRDAWAGPVTDSLYEFGKVKVEADDLSAWWDVRRIPSLAFSDLPPTEVFRNLHNACMEVDPIDNFNIFVPDSLQTKRIDRTYAGGDDRYCIEAIEDLADTEVDWTAYGRSIIVDEDEIRLSPYLRFTDDMWTVPPSVRARGNEQATVVIVRGKDGVRAVAKAPQAYLDYYGVIERVFEESDLTTIDECQRSADSKLALYRDQLYIETPQGAALKPTAPVTLPELIPGIRCRVESTSTCRKVTGDFRLDTVRVEFESGKVSLTLQPLGMMNERF